MSRVLRNHWESKLFLHFPSGRDFHTVLKLTPFLSYLFFFFLASGLHALEGSMFWLSECDFSRLDSACFPLIVHNPGGPPGLWPISVKQAESTGAWWNAFPQDKDNKNHLVNFTGATFVNHLHRQHLLILNHVHLILTASNSQRK